MGRAAEGEGGGRKGESYLWTWLLSPFFSLSLWVSSFLVAHFPSQTRVKPSIIRFCKNKDRVIRVHTASLPCSFHLMIPPLPLKQWNKFRMRIKHILPSMFTHTKNLPRVTITHSATVDLKHKFLKAIFVYDVATWTYIEPVGFQIWSHYNQTLRIVFLWYFYTIEKHKIVNNSKVEDYI